MADLPVTSTTNITDSKKGQGLIIGLAAGLVVSAAAVAAGPVAIGVLPQVLEFIALLTLGHQGSQVLQDVFKAKNPVPPCDPPAPK